MIILTQHIKYSTVWSCVHAGFVLRSSHFTYVPRSWYLFTDLHLVFSFVFCCMTFLEIDFIVWISDTICLAKYKVKVSSFLFLDKSIIFCKITCQMSFLRICEHMLWFGILIAMKLTEYILKHVISFVIIIEIFSFSSCTFCVTTVFSTFCCQNIWIAIFIFILQLCYSFLFIYDHILLVSIIINSTLFWLLKRN